MTNNDTCSVFQKVLIDTWWNVNDSKFAEFVQAIPVLIDTWWNVNYGRFT